MNAPLPRQLLAVAISLTMNAMMIGGVAWLLEISSPRFSSEHACATAVAWVALA